MIVNHTRFLLAICTALLFGFAAPTATAAAPAPVAAPQCAGPGCYTETFQNLTARIQVTDIGGFVVMDVDFYYLNVLYLGSVNGVLMPSYTSLPINFQFGGPTHWFSPELGETWADVAAGGGIGYAWV